MIWLAIVPVAIINGTVRDMLIAPSLGDPIARALSCLILSAAVLLIASMSIRWIGARTATDAWRIGTLWLALTLAFEFVVGHYVFGSPWDALLADYDVFDGRLWIVVLAATLSAPRLAQRVRRLFPRHDRGMVRQIA
jgi:hypothetical protein